MDLSERKFDIIILGYLIEAKQNRMEFHTLGAK